MLLGRLLGWLDDRVGGARFGSKALKKVFPNHWTFLLGEIALYCFVVLVVTGVYLTFFFEPSSRVVVYDGEYEPLRGVEMSAAFKSAMDISFEVRAGLVMRQMHHWAALLFIASMSVHLMRVFFTGAFRRPRELNWIVGLTLLVLGIANGFFGYSLLDDLLSGTGVRVAYSIALSVPFLGPALAFAVFGGEFPAEEIIPRFYVLHILILPAAIATLIGVHLALVWRQRHTQYPGGDRTEHNVVGIRAWPAFAMKSTGLMFITAGVIAGLGGLAQINPIWVYGPFRSDIAVTAVTSASQPDWYMGWVDGALRIFPGWETRVGDYMIPNPFFPGVLLPTIAFGVLYLWPFLEARFRHDHEPHHLLERPRDAPVRTAIGAAGLAGFTILFLAGSNDVLAATFELAPETVTLIFRVLVIVLPVLVFFVTRRICRDLRRSGARPIRDRGRTRLVRRGERIEAEAVPAGSDERERAAAEDAAQPARR
jgi:ubiquinol-cytochrome c reductase cytochrome b subunit